MASLIELGDAAYARFSRTIRWGDELLARLQTVKNGNLPPDLMGPIEDFFGSAAYCVNFFSDGTALDQVETLGFDPRQQISIEELAEWSIPRLRSTLSMRVTLLRKWFDEHLTGLGRLESLHHQTLGILAATDDNAPVQRTTLQMRLKVENRLLFDALDYLALQGLLEFDKESDLVWITDDGKEEVRKLSARNPSMAKQYRPHDLVFFSYARVDTQQVEEVHDHLDQNGFSTWWDQKHLVGGQDWDLEIRKAIMDAAVCLVFLSKHSVEKTGYVNKEIKRILDKMDTMPEGKVFMIPIRLDDCPIPMRLSQWQVIDYSKPDAKQRIIEAVRNAI